VFGGVAKNIKDVRIAKNPEGKCRGFAYVEFNDEKSLPAALQKDKKTVKGRQINVLMSAPKSTDRTIKQHASSTPPSSSTEQSAPTPNRKHKLMIPRSIKPTTLPTKGDNADAGNNASNNNNNNSKPVDGASQQPPPQVESKSKSNDYFKQLVNKGK